MNSPFKFPRRVRIHGGECGAAARALHHEAQKVALIQNEQSLISDECVFLRQADLKKSFRSTFIERKQMSTKTTFKRIALATVAVMGFGLLSVVPAQAAITTTGLTDVVTPVGSDGSNSTDTITSVVTTYGAVSRTSTVNLGGITHTIPYSLAVTGTGFDADTSEFTIDAGEVQGTFTSTATTSTIAFATAVATVNSATSVTIAGNITVTADSKTKANLLLAAGTYTLGINVDNAGLDSDKTATALAFSTGSGVFFSAPTLLTSKVSNSAVTQIIGGQANLLFNGAGSDAAARYLVTVTGGTMSQASSSAATTVVYFTDTGNAVTGGLGTYNSGFTIAENTNVSTALDNIDTVTVVISNSTAGVSTVSYTPISAAGIPGAASTATITWVVASDAYKNAAVTKILGTSNSSGSTYYASASASANPVATFSVVQSDAAGAAIGTAASKAVVVSITGVGSLASATGGSSTTVTAAPAATWPNDGTGQFSVFGNGSAGTSTVNVAVNGVTVWSKSFVFYGAAASITAEVVYSIVRAGGYEVGSLDYAAGVPTADNDPAIAVTVKDAAGNAVPSAVTFVSSNGAVILAAATDTFVDTGTSAFSAGFGVNHFTYSSTPTSTSGQTANLTFTLGTLTSNVVTVKTGGTKTGGTVTMTLDKASYEPGARMILTLTAKDSAGNAVHDGATTGTPSSNKNIVGLSSAGSMYYDGTHVFGDGATEFLYAPTTSGAFEITLATGTATSATITVTATVGDDAATSAANAASDAAAEAIDAANAATDAANLAAEAADAATVAAEEARDAADAATAAVEALATEVATLMAALKAQITTLANVVAKIAKRTKS